MNEHVHAALACQIIHSVSHVLQIRVRGGDDVDHTANLSRRCCVRVVMVVAVMVMIVRAPGIFLIEPEARNGVADDTADFAELLECNLNTVLHVVGNDEQQLLARRHDEWHRCGENEDGDDDRCERVPEVPRFPQGHGSREDDGERAAGVSSDM